MKRSLKIAAALLCGALALQPCLMTATAQSTPDVSWTGGRISYSTSDGLLLCAFDTTYDVRAPEEGVTPYYGASLPLGGAQAPLTVTVTNESAQKQSVTFVLVTADGEEELSETVNPGVNTFTLSAEKVTGEVTSLKVICNAFMCRNVTIVVNKVTSGEQDVWTSSSGFTEIKNDAVTATVYLIRSGMLQGAGLQSGEWYPILWHGAQDMTGYEGFSFYADTTVQGKEVYFNKYIQEFRSDVEGPIEQWYTADEATYNCYPEGGTPFVMSGNLIPAYFKGTIVVPFSSFSLPNFSDSENGELDLDQTDGLIGFTFDGARGDFAFRLTDFKLVEKVAAVENTVYTQGDISFIDEMSGYSNSTVANYLWRTNWTLASPCTVELVQHPNPTTGAGGNALRITPLDAPENPAPDPTTGSSTPTGFTALEYFPTGGSFDISGKKGITFFVKNEKAAPLCISFEFDILQEGLRQRWAVKQYGRYTLYDTVTGTQKLYNAFNGIYVPAGFCGWVRVNFSQFVNPSWESVAGDFTTQTGLVYFVLNIETLRYSGHTFLFDSLGVYGEETGIATQFHTPQKDIAAAIGGNA